MSLTKVSDKASEKTTKAIDTIVQSVKCQDQKYQEFAQQMVNLEIQRTLAFWLQESNRINSLQNIKENE